MNNSYDWFKCPECEAFIASRSNDNYCLNHNKKMYEVKGKELERIVEARRSFEPDESGSASDYMRY